MIDSQVSALTKIQEDALSKLPIEIAQALLRLRDRVVARFPNEVMHFILYGSFARGEAHSESDVDVMIVTTWPVKRLPGGWYESWHGDPRWAEIISMATDAMLECGRYVSALVVDEAYFNLGEDAMGEAQREGLDLLDWPSNRPLSINQGQTRREYALKETPVIYDVDEPANFDDPLLWLSMADDKLQVARDLAQLKHYGDVVSKCYYAMFYGAKAALASIGVKVKSHKGAISEFGRFFVATKRIGNEYSTMLAQAIEDRLETDYSPKRRTTQERSEAAIATAETFIAKAHELVEAELSNGN